MNVDMIVAKIIMAIRPEPIAYDIVYAESHSGLRDKVNMMLDEGWDVKGQAFFARDIWNQTIVKYK